MPIPESQLETWTRKGADATSSVTYSSIQTALAAVSSPIRFQDYEVYLQGSYKNDTNIRGDSDVDVVVQLNSSFYRDLSGLPADQQRLEVAAYPDASYQWPEFRRDVLQALRAYYGSRAATEGDRSLKLERGGGRLAADIIPALHFRKYLYFFSKERKDCVDGIKFFRRDNREIINFPKPHYKNGVSKNSASHTNGWYKPTVRIFKNVRTYLINQNRISEDLAPSYFLECLVYNVPDAKFGVNFQDTFVNAFNWLLQAAPSVFKCQNEQFPLFGSTPEQWDVLKASQFLSSVKTLWESW
jgi:hypothetical protein